MTKQDDDRASRPDDANPEWTQDEIRDARPALEVFEEIFGPAAAETVKRGRGRPAKADKKVNQTLRLDVDVLDAYRGNGPGWQALMNQVLREHMPSMAK
ncbi:BrnA antitoxin family protein [Rhodopila sp.]|uniref:BrnA antitoxin family protein n=1 Tax=Rhodopila sp. TaxID=2480087 RepID=UPI003D1073B5